MKTVSIVGTDNIHERIYSAFINAWRGRRIAAAAECRLDRHPVVYISGEFDRPLALAHFRALGGSEVILIWRPRRPRGQRETVEAE